MRFVYYAYAASKWWKILKYNLFIGIISVCISCCNVRVICSTWIVIYFNPNLVGWFGILSCKSVFDIPLLYYINFLPLILSRQNLSSFNLKSSIIFCFSSGNIYFSLSISSSFFSELFFDGSCDFFSNFIFNQITSCFCCFLHRSFWCSFKCIYSILFIILKKFLTVFTSYFFTYIFTKIFTHIFSKKQKSITFYKYLVFRLNWIACHVYMLYFN